MGLQLMAAMSFVEYWVYMSALPLKLWNSAMSMKQCTGIIMIITQTNGN